MDLSVVIVNYNVRHFLEQCLKSVFIAGQNIDMEVFVVDNNSVDGSTDMLRQQFPQVHLIANKTNAGFSKANNQAIKVSSGRYVLLLNPDTVVEKDTFEKIIHYMDEHPKAGGLGVKMMDGQGKFLPESKRGLPTPAVAFYKITGLSRLFPRSKTFNRYHLGFLDAEEIHSVDVLAGAFMLLRRKTLDEVGLLDEDYFMYGEDIDLSYRIVQGGYQNIYFPKTRIIHYKGESTKKRSANYVFTFYNAMIIFARKHFSNRHARIFSFLINIAIYLRASMAIVNRYWKKLYLPLLDAAVIFGGMWFIKSFWESSVKSVDGSMYPPEYLWFVVPSYIAVWLFAIYMNGGYDKPYHSRGVFKGLISGTVAILVVYALLPESIRFSRALIILGAVWALLSVLLIRYITRISSRNLKHHINPEEKRYLITGDKEEAMRVAGILKSSSPAVGFIGFCSPTPTEDPFFAGSIKQLDDITEIFKIDEIIFCARNLSAEQIIDYMSDLSSGHIDYKIAPQESMFLIGSNSISSASDLFSIDINSVSRPVNRRSKRFFDLIASFLLLLLFPFTLWFIKRPGGHLLNIFKVLTGRYSWVGYNPKDKQSEDHLPNIRPGILYPSDVFHDKKLTTSTLHRLNLLYAKDYKLATDFNTIWKGFRKLGRKS
ncbi:MAG: glycosyltransferase [Bacteroidales bacterium]